MFAYTRLAQTYRFNLNATFEVSMTDVPGTAYELTSSNETAGRYIPAVAIMQEDSTIKIIVKGDYTVNTASFTAVNMTNGTRTSLTLNNSLFLQDASYLGDYPAEDNKNKQITVLYNLDVLADNTIYASLDLNNDGVYNWIEIGDFVDGIDGKSIIVINNDNYSSVSGLARVGDTVLAGETFSNSGHDFVVGGLYRIDSKAPFVYTPVGNIRGAQGAAGANGQNGQNGTKVISDSGVPSNDIGENGDTYIDTSTWNVYTKENGSWTSAGNIKGADGQNGINGQNGQSFQMQSGLYSVPANWGESGNVDPDGNALLQLPTLPQSAISGKGYVVFDPLTTPLAPFYDLYYANNGDNNWTIIHPFSGIAGQDGTDGETPYISGGTWWIGSTNTGVAATGPQGPAGPGVPSGGTTGQVLVKKSNTDYDTEWGKNVDSLIDLETPEQTFNLTSGTIKKLNGNTIRFIDKNYPNNWIQITTGGTGQRTLVTFNRGSGTNQSVIELLSNGNVIFGRTSNGDIKLPIVPVNTTETFALTKDCKLFNHAIKLNQFLSINLITKSNVAFTVDTLKSYLQTSGIKAPIISGNLHAYLGTDDIVEKAYVAYVDTQVDTKIVIDYATVNYISSETTHSVYYQNIATSVGSFTDTVTEI